MVAPVFRNEVVQPRTVEAFEGMMKDLLKEAKNYKSPFVATKKPVVHNPAKNPFAPLYRPDREILYTVDKYHPFEPPKSLYKERPKEKVFAAAGGSVPPPGDGNGSSNINKNIEKVLVDNKNNILSDNYAEYKNKYKK